MSITITITGSHLDCFTAVELSLASTDAAIQIGRVFERPDGWKCELFADDASRVVPLEELVSHLQKAKEALVPYINRTGVNPPSGLTPATLSFVADDESRWHGDGYEGRMVGSMGSWGFR